MSERLADGSDTVSRLDTFACDAGWRDYHFLRITTSAGVEGWAEFDEGVGLASGAVEHMITQMAPSVINRPVFDHEGTFQLLFARTRQTARGLNGMAIGAIENALLDAMARTLGVPCYQLLGGAVRTRIPIYWSHCGTWRINLPHVYGNPVTDLAGIEALGAEVAASSIGALKTNIFLPGHDDDGNPRLRAWAPGFGVPPAPELNLEMADLRELRKLLEAFAAGAGSDVGILLDLNFNFTTAGCLQVVRALRDFDLFWLEIDNDHPEALAQVRDAAHFPISGGETLMGAEQLVPFLEAGALDVAIIDGIWNGMWQAQKMAATAAAYGVNTAPHNFYGHLATMMNAHFAAATPNLRIMETDIDRIGWDDELVTSAPLIEDGHIVLDDEPGWGTVPVLEAIAAHPPRSR